MKTHTDTRKDSSTMQKNRNTINKINNMKKKEMPPHRHTSSKTPRHTIRKNSNENFNKRQLCIFASCQAIDMLNPSILNQFFSIPKERRAKKNIKTMFHALVPFKPYFIKKKKITMTMKTNTNNHKQSGR